VRFRSGIVVLFSCRHAGYAAGKRSVSVLAGGMCSGGIVSHDDLEVRRSEVDVVGFVMR